MERILLHACHIKCIYCYYISFSLEHNNKENHYSGNTTWLTILYPETTWFILWRCSKWFSLKDTRAFRISTYYSSGHFVHSFGALITAFPVVSNFAKLCDSQRNKQSQSFKNTNCRKLPQHSSSKGLPVLCSRCCWCVQVKLLMH